MRAFGTLTRRELAAYFVSPTGYIILASSLFLMGFSFVVLLISLQREPTLMPVTEIFYMTQFFWLILLLSTPAITMRLFALEKFSGTYETLMTTPVTDLEVVMAKFTAALTFYVLMWLPLIGCIFIVKHYTNDSTPFDFGVVGSTYLGIILLGAVCLSLGCCASALTRSQVTAAILSLAFGGTLFMIGWLARQVPARGTWHGQVLACLDFFEQMHDFSRGLVDTRPIVLFVTFTLFFLFLTLRIVESRRWK